MATAHRLRHAKPRPEFLHLMRCSADLVSPVLLANLEILTASFTRHWHR